jgi:glyoxylase-like metal-dependent hydrolase (beta-lactamase superfamily II)
MFDFEKGPIKFIRGEGYPHCHTVFVDAERRTLIDAASREPILKAIHQERPVQILLVSHGHEDHMMYNYLFPEAEFWVPEADAPVFQDLDLLIDCYTPESEDQKRLWREVLLETCHYEARKPDRLLREGDTLELGGTRCRVIHTPGHTPGHCAFHFIEEQVLFLGDLDLTKAGPYYGDVEGSIEQTVASLRRLASIPVEVYLTAHGKGIFDGDPDHILRYLKIIESREERLLDLLSEGPKSLDQITQAGIIYGPPRIIAGCWDLSLSEKAMMKKHLELLQQQGKVTFEEWLFRRRS